MKTVCPTITAENPHVYREQIERVGAFADRIHVDLMDGVLTPNRSIELSQLWWPEGKMIDIHLMYANPSAVLEQIVALKPDLLIVHASTISGLQDIRSILNPVGIKLGVVLMPEDTVSDIAELLPILDHVLIFSGNLGYQGGSSANLSLLSKVGQIRELSADIEVGWDGGVNDTNIQKIAKAEVDVINSGGYVHFAAEPRRAYETLTDQIASNTPVN